MRQPGDAFEYPIGRFRYDRVFNITFDNPWSVEASQLFSCCLVEIECDVRVIMQKGRRDVSPYLSLDGFLDDGSLAFRPGHNYDFLSLLDSIDSHANSTFGYFLNTSK